MASAVLNQSALKAWAYNQGDQGLPLWRGDRHRIDRTRHGRARFPRGRPDREIDAYANERLVAPFIFARPETLLANSTSGDSSAMSRAIARETALFSERLQYGGTPDTGAAGEGWGMLPSV
jgi:hypothetical protein